MYQKRKIAVMLAVILIIQVMLPTLSIIFENGLTLKSIANSENEYYINTEEDLWNFAEEVNNGNTFEGVKVYLISDINLECNEEKQWIPIGNYNANSLYEFNGIFDGQNKTIKGIYINNDKRYQGLFGKNSGTIKNMNIDYGTITNTTVVQEV